MSTGSTDAARAAERWRRLEAEARIIALAATDPATKKAMLFVAHGYNVLAERQDEVDLRTRKVIARIATLGFLSRAR